MPPTPSKRLLTALTFALVPLLGWYWAFQQRASWIRPACRDLPASCDPASLNVLDALVPVRFDLTADYWSFVTQDLAGALAVLMALTLAWRRRKVRELSRELLLLLQVTFTNGFINECLHLWTQRPRPFVYLDPIRHGGSSAHYTSFYSGHTSFAALAATCAWYSARRAGLAPRARTAVALLGAGLAISTGTLRVAAGRHFISDVAVGALMGLLFARLINRLHDSSPSVR
jgi:membrane-associated phospholipid phosphatase